MTDPTIRLLGNRMMTRSCHSLFPNLNHGFTTPRFSTRVIFPPIQVKLCCLATPNSMCLKSLSINAMEFPPSSPFFSRYRHSFSTQYCSFNFLIQPPLLCKWCPASPPSSQASSFTEHRGFIPPLKLAYLSFLPLFYPSSFPVQARKCLDSRLRVWP